MTDLALMQQIRAQWQTQLAAAVKDKNIPEAFLAAVVANESGGDPAAKRFEKSVLFTLWEVLLGRLPKFGSILRADLVNYVAGFSSTPVTVPISLPANAFQKVDELATSWGLTQIMGYHVLEWFTIPSPIPAVDDLRDGAKNLVAAVGLLITFANRWNLQLGESGDYGQLLHCWNTGRPDAPTFDPGYAPNGLHRMDLYRSLETGGTEGG